jgi:N-acetylmuramoyl-L-alanine amidase/Mannosyl-glycoprotein endo-beta-N-acetylglucosaminidase
MNILGSVVPICLDRALAWSKVHLPVKYQNIITDYKKHGETYSVRWDWAFAQACHETGIFAFGGDVKPNQNNFAGIAATGNGVPGDSFDTISDGVLGHIQHLACYAGVDIPASELKADRTKQVKNYILGKSKTWEEVAKNWATDSEYLDRLQYHYRRVFEPREQNPGWYRLVEQGQQKFFVAMSGDYPIFKYPVANHSLATLRDTCDQLLKVFPGDRDVRSDKSMDLSDIPDYQQRGGNGGGNGGNPWNNLPTTEPPYFWRHSPNCSQRNGQIGYIILHNTAGEFWGSVSWLCDSQAKASAHLVIPRSGGEIAALVNEQDAAWHAGSSRWNHCSIGIEIEATEEKRGMTDAQEKLVVQQLNHLLLKYNLTPDKIDIHRRVCRSPLPDVPTSQGSPETDCPILIWPDDSDFLAWRKKWYGV